MEEALECCSDKGYSCTEEWTTLTDESVTTVLAEDGNSAYAELAYEEDITADTIRVTFNGTEYICQRHTENNDYGALFNDAQSSFDWPEYPFNLYSDGGNEFSTQSVGTYSVKIETSREVVETSECFEKAVSNSIDVETIIYYKEDPYSNTVLCNRTLDEVMRLININYNKPVKVVYDSTGAYAHGTPIDQTGAITLISQYSNVAFFVGILGFTGTPFRAVQFVTISHTSNDISISSYEIKSAT